MKIVITLGPSYEPIDGARRLTNFSTGALGTRLANAFTDAGAHVIAFRGEGATTSERIAGPKVVPFATNADLLNGLESLPDRKSIRGVFHVAALCDYQVSEVQSETGDRLQEKKISTRGGDLILRLKPAPKVIQSLPRLFPNARIVGWKYELNGSRNDAIQKGRDQIQSQQTTGCVVNGAAYGPGFGFLENANAPVIELGEENALVNYLLRWMGLTRAADERKTAFNDNVSMT